MELGASYAHACFKTKLVEVLLLQLMCLSAFNSCSQLHAAEGVLAASSFMNPFVFQCRTAFITFYFFVN